MVPTVTAVADDLTNDFVTLAEADLPSLTYAMELSSGRVRGYADGQAAMRQAIFKILQTERYDHVIYSSDYGVELRSLIGMPIPYVLPEIERRISEALLWDSRIETVSGFEFSVEKNKVLVSFSAGTIFGAVEISTEVAF